MNCSRLFGFLLLTALTALGGWGHATAPPPPIEQVSHWPNSLSEIPLRRGLMLPCVGMIGRKPLVVNPVLAAWAKGENWPPQAGDKVALPNGHTEVWEPLDAKPDGTFESPRLCGGFCQVTLFRAQASVMMLEARGHLLALVNGEPLEGDMYGHGWARYPVFLHAGDNHFLFLVLPKSTCLQAKLTRPQGDAFIVPYDHTVAHAVAGQSYRAWAAVPVVNASLETLSDLTLTTTTAGATPITTPVPPLPPLTLRKVPIELMASSAGETKLDFTVKLERPGRDRPMDVLRLAVGVRAAEQSRLLTFRSQIDGSVQNYAYRPPLPGNSGPPGLLLTLHGAGTEALAHLEHYQPKTWCHLVAPTNRRAFGFDWEDWGRLDALEVLALAIKDHGTDPRRTWLTGHSMGGHGVWHLGTNYPDKFAALGPSAGWICLSTYARKPADPPASPLEMLLQRGSSPNDPLALVENLREPGVYILHGEKDDTVHVQLARKMRDALTKLKKQFEYHEHPGAGHWWGTACVDWPPLMDFLPRHTLPAISEVRDVRFVTASPGVSASCHWATIEAQEKQWQRSAVQLHLAVPQRRIHGTTANVSRLSLDLGPLPPGAPVQLELDGQKLSLIPWPAEKRLWLQRTAGKWAIMPLPSMALKGPHRYGGFKDAFRNNFLFVYGTKGTPAENAWALAHARYLAAVFWHRGNGSVDILPDHAFDPTSEPNRNVILLGNADTNAAWPALLGSCPVQLRRQSVQCGERTWEGDNLGGMFIYPRPGSNTASVGVIGGTGLPGMRAITFLPLFVSGVAYPDCLLVDTTMLTQGLPGIRCAGYFGIDWQVKTGEFVLP